MWEGKQNEDIRADEANDRSDEVALWPGGGATGGRPARTIGEQRAAVETVVPLFSMSTPGHLPEKAQAYL